MSRYTYEYLPGIRVVSTPGTCGGRWRLDNHRITTRHLFTLYSLEVRRLPPATAIAKIAIWYELTEVEVEAALAFEMTLDGAIVRLRKEIDEAKWTVLSMLRVPRAMQRLIPPSLRVRYWAFRLEVAEWRTRRA